MTARRSRLQLAPEGTTLKKAENIDERIKPTPDDPYEVARVPNSEQHPDSLKASGSDSGSDPVDSATKAQMPTKLSRLRHAFLWYVEMLERIARGRAPRLLSLGALAVVLVAAGVVLYSAEGAQWGNLVAWIMVVPIGVSAMLVLDQAPRLRSSMLHRVWPERRTWAPIFRRQLWLPAVAGIALSVFVALAPMTSAEAPETATNVGDIVVLALGVVIQALYLWACSLVLREGSAIRAGLPRNLIVSWVAAGVWVVSTIGPMIVTIAVREHNQTLGVVGVLITVPGLFVLAVMCRGLQAWDENEAVRHDIAGYAIQGGAIFFLLWLSICASELATAFSWGEPDMLNEIFRTLLYGATLLLVPSGWWTLHVITTAPLEKAAGRARREPDSSAEAAN